VKTTMTQKQLHSQPLQRGCCSSSWSTSVFEAS
jgi:hypothetical protein